MFVNAGRGCKRRPNGRGILQSWSHNCLIYLFYFIDFIHIMVYNAHNYLKIYKII